MGAPTYIVLEGLSVNPTCNLLCWLNNVHFLLKRTGPQNHTHLKPLTLVTNMLTVGKI